MWKKYLEKYIYLVEIFLDSKRRLLIFGRHFIIENSVGFIMIREFHKSEHNSLFSYKTENSAVRRQGYFKNDRRFVFGFPPFRKNLTCHHIIVLKIN